MKKVLFGLFALSTLAIASETNLYLRAGGDLNGKFDTVSYNNVNFNKDEADDFSWEIALEATKEVYSNLELGLGLAYQKHGDAKSNNDFLVFSDLPNDIFDTKLEMSGYTSIPLYLVAKYNFNAINNFVPYVKANLGYSFNDEDGDFTMTGITEFGYKDGTKGSVKIDNGLYYGLGAGFEYNNFTMDLMYQVNLAEAEVTISDLDANVKKDFDYSRITLGFGYKFDF